VFQKLLKTISHLEEPLMECSNKEAMIDLVCCIRTSPRHGVHRFGHRFRMVLSARSDDTKSLKGVGLDWISSRDISLVCYIRTLPCHGVHRFGHRFRMVACARSDDTKSLKGVGLNWISSRNISLNRLLHWHVMLIEGDAIGQCSHP